MKIPLLNIYILTGKSFRRQQEETAIATRSMSVKVMEGLLFENAVLKQGLEEVKRKQKKGN